MSHTHQTCPVCKVEKILSHFSPDPTTGRRSLTFIDCTVGDVTYLPHKTCHRCRKFLPISAYSTERGGIVIGVCRNCVSAASHKGVAKRQRHVRRSLGEGGSKPRRP